MFEFKFTKSDLVRAAWTFVVAAVGVFVVARPATGDDWKVAAVAAVAAGLAALKNFVLKDGTTLKG